MSDQLKKLQNSASRLAWPAFAAGLVVLGGYGSHQIAKAKDPVGVAANSTALLLVTAFAGYTKGVNQSRRDQELGILDKDRDINITNKNFVVAAERHEGLDNQTTILANAGCSSIFSAAVIISVGAPAAAAAAAFGAGVVLLSMGRATLIRETELLPQLQDAAREIRQDGSGLNNPAIRKAVDYVGRCYL